MSFALAGPPTPDWSQDGTAEAAALRRRVEAHDDAAAEKELGTRGLVFIANPDAPGGTTPGTPTLPGERTDDTPHVALDDLQRQADLERIVRKGRRLFIPGIVLATLGTILTIGGIAGVAKQPNAASGGFFGASAAIAAIGWPLAVAGIRRRRHPEKFLHTSVAIAPGGIVLRF
ncbi:MAG TPA: hypothetical protein VG755_22130 [Nannocystaceae bacterium]|nr:hypothetical protein [Nannocystaceae bacterium]